MRPHIERGAAGKEVTAASLRRIPLFRAVPEEVLAPLAAASSRQVLGHGDLLWQPDQEIEAAFALAAGEVRLYHHLESDKEAIVALLDHGQVCGLTDLTAAFVPTTSAQALVDETVVYRLPRRAVVRSLRDDPDLALRVIAHVGGRLRDAYDLHALPDARARVAYILAHLATANRERIVWLTHEELAPLAGVGREAITRYVLPDLREQGLIAYGGHRRGIRVLNSQQLLALLRHGM